MGAERVSVDELADRIGVGDRSHISIVGGGGKTTTLFALGAAVPGRAILTTTTRMGSERDGGVHVAVDPSDAALERAIDSHRQVLVWRERTGHKAVGVAPDDCDRWFAGGLADHVVVEADGSRQRPFKAPLAYEPVVATTTTLLAICVGIDALGQPISQGCQRPHAVAALGGTRTSQPLTPEVAARVIRHPQGSMKGRPADAEAIVLVHRVHPDRRREVDELASLLGDLRVFAVAPQGQTQA